MSLFWRVYLAVYVAFIVLVAATSWFYTQQMIRLEYRQTADGVRLTGRFLTTAIERGAVDGKWPLANLRFATQTPDFSFWWLTDQSGTIFLANESEYLNGRPETWLSKTALEPVDKEPSSIRFLHENNLCLYREPVVTRSETLTFWFATSLDAANENQRRTLIRYAGIATLTLIGFGVILYFIVSRFSAPLLLLNRGLKQISKGDYRARVPVSTNDEMGQLAEGFNAMTESIEQSTEELAESRNQYRSTVDALEDGLLVVDHADQIRFINQSLRNWFSRQGLPVPQPGEAVVAEIPFMATLWTPTIRQELLPHPFTPIERRMTVNQRILSVRINLMGAQKESSQQPSVLVVFRDLTRQLQIDSELARLQKLESLGTLAGGIAHDFNNMLSSVLSSVTLAHQAAKQNRQSSALEDELISAKEGTLRAQRLAKRLITFSHGGQPEIESARSQELLDQAIGLVSQQASIRIVHRIPKDLWSVRVDSDQILQVFQNLVLNACQAMENQGQLTVIAENQTLDTRFSEAGLQRGAYVHFQFRDTGTGIHPKDLKRVFDPFFTTKKEGHGLGLATAHSIVQQHGGILRVESELGDGSTFHIYLPAVELEPPELDPKEPARAEKPVPKPPPNTGQGSILFMDDDDAIRSVVERMANFLGYQATTVSSGREAIDVLRTALARGQSYDVVFLDLTVSKGAGGRETLPHLRNLAPSLYVVATSGYAAAATRRELKELGFASLLAKPFGLEEFKAAILSRPKISGDETDSN